MKQKTNTLKQQYKNNMFGKSTESYKIKALNPEKKIDNLTSK